MPRRASRANLDATWDDQNMADVRPRWAMRLLRKVASRPRKLIPPSLVGAAILPVLVNALFLQPGPHPAPIFAPRPLPVATNDATGSVPSVLPRPRPADIPLKTEIAVPQSPRLQAQGPDLVKPVAGMRTAQPAPALQMAAHNVPAVHPGAPSRRVLSVQRALSEFGYGQLNPTGIEDASTTAAIQKFEREHRLPVSGQISDQLIRALAATTGRSLD